MQNNILFFGDTLYGQTGNGTSSCGEEYNVKKGNKEAISSIYYRGFWEEYPFQYKFGEEIKILKIGGVYRVDQ